jgi:hypothetical protein
MMWTEDQEKELTDEQLSPKLNVPVNPPLWTKPAAALAAPGEEIHMSKYCASNFPDWEVSFNEFPRHMAGL